MLFSLASFSHKETCFRWMVCQHFSQMVTSVSLAGHCISFPRFFSTYMFCGGRWGKNSLLGICGGETNLYVHNLQIFIELSLQEPHHLNNPRQLFFFILEHELSPQPHIFGNWEPWKIYVFTHPSALVSFCPRYKGLISFLFSFILDNLFSVVQFINSKSFVF